MLADFVLGDVFAGFMLGLGFASLALGMVYGRLVRMISNLQKAIEDLIRFVKRVSHDPDARPDDDDDLWDKIGMNDPDE